MLTSALLAYIPLTHMAHFIAKYFTYHAVRWDDRAERPGRQPGGQAGRVPDLPSHVVGSARGADGKKTWAEVATTNPAQGARK